MSEVVLTNQASPGALGAGVTALYADANGSPAFVGNDAVAHVLAALATALTDAATIAVDAKSAPLHKFSVTLGGNRTLGNPTNMVDGGRYVFKFKQDGTGSRTLAYSSKFKFSGATAPTLSTVANRVDMITATYDAADDILLCVFTQDLR